MADADAAAAAGVASHPLGSALEGGSGAVGGGARAAPHDQAFPGAKRNTTRAAWQTQCTRWAIAACAVLFALAMSAVAKDKEAGVPMTDAAELVAHATDDAPPPVVEMTAHDPDPPNDRPCYASAAEIAAADTVDALNAASAKYVPQLLPGSVPPACEGPEGVALCRKAVVEAISHAWNGYEAHAWGHDDLTPVGPRGTPTGVDWLRFGLTIVDSLDTLLLANLTEEYERGREWVRTCLHFDLEFGVCMSSPREASEGHPMSGVRKPPMCRCATERRGGGGGDGGGSGQRNVNVFETTIRVVGGLLGAHTIARDRDGADAVLLEKAEEFARGLAPAFQTRSSIPRSDINPATGEAAGPGWIDASSVAEAGSLLLEYGTVGMLGTSRYLHALADDAMARIGQLSRAWSEGCPGLVPTFLKVDEDDAPLHAAFASDKGHRSDPPEEPTARQGRPKKRRAHYGSFDSSFGGRSDSYYETLLKAYVWSNKTRTDYLELYRMAVDCARGILVRQTSGGLWAVGKCGFRGGGGGDNPPSCTYTPQMDHLACFLPGTLALGWMHGADPRSANLNATHAYTAGDDGGRGEGDGFPDVLDDLALAKELMRTCWEAYARSPLGMGPEIMHFTVASAGQRRAHRQGAPAASTAFQRLWTSATDAGGAEAWHEAGSHEADSGRLAGRRRAAKSRRDTPRATTTQLGLGLNIRIADAHHILRPEMVESLYYLWRATGDPMYREWGRRYLATLNWCCRHPDAGYGGLTSVLEDPGDAALRDDPSRLPMDPRVPSRFAKKKMESFFLAESLKYLLLLFTEDDGAVCAGTSAPRPPDLFNYVYNTEAHAVAVLGGGA